MCCSFVACSCALLPMINPDVASMISLIIFIIIVSSSSSIMSRCMMMMMMMMISSSSSSSSILRFLGRAKVLSLYKASTGGHPSDQIR